jgi:hypothetical protein
VALFAALSYAITQSGRGGGSITRERAQLDAALAAQCTAAVEYGVNKLMVLNDCAADEISYELTDGTNENPSNPSDTTCFLFDANGAGVTPCGPYLEGNNCPDSVLEDLAIGGVGCGTIAYAGISGGNRIYTTLADSGTKTWNDGSGNWSATGATSSSDGLANTDTLVAFSGLGSPHQAAHTCRGLGAQWYLPARDELNLLYTNKAVGALNGTFDTSGTVYWTSFEVNNAGVEVLRFSNGAQDQHTKNQGRAVRCVRR